MTDIKIIELLEKRLENAKYFEKKHYNLALEAEFNSDEFEMEKEICQEYTRVAWELEYIINEIIDNIEEDLGIQNTRINNEE